MLKIQHIGIPTTDIYKTINFYKDLNFHVVFKTILPDGVKVAFIDISDQIFEFYETEVNNYEIPNINKIVLKNPILNETIYGPSKECLEFIKSEKSCLDYIEINSSNIKKTIDSLKLHDFISENNEIVINGSVKFKINKVNGNITKGAIDHIAFDCKTVLKKQQDIVAKNIPVIEGINFLPFFKNGVIYFVTENTDGLKLEYNQILI